jgi:hypothetical protein
MADGRTSWERDLKDTRSVGAQAGEQRAEIKIVRENDPAVGRGESKISESGTLG